MSTEAIRKMFEQAAAFAAMVHRMQTRPIGKTSLHE